MVLSQKIGDVVLSRDEFNVDGPLVPERIEETLERTGELLLAIDGMSAGINLAFDLLHPRCRTCLASQVTGTRELKI